MGLRLTLRSIYDLDLDLIVRMLTEWAKLKLAKRPAGRTHVLLLLQNGRIKKTFEVPYGPFRTQVSVGTLSMARNNDSCCRRHEPMDGNRTYMTISVIYVCRGDFKRKKVKYPESYVLAWALFWSHLTNKTQINLGPHLFTTYSCMEIMIFPINHSIWSGGCRSLSEGRAIILTVWIDTIVNHIIICTEKYTMNHALPDYQCSFFFTLVFTFCYQAIIT